MWSQRDITLSHFLVKSILRFSPLLLLLRFWKIHKRIKRKMLYRKRFRRSEKLKRIKRKTKNSKNLKSFWRKYDIFMIYFTFFLVYFSIFHIYYNMFYEYSYFLLYNVGFILKIISRVAWESISNSFDYAPIIATIKVDGILHPQIKAWFFWE